MERTETRETPEHLLMERMIRLVRAHHRLVEHIASDSGLHRSQHMLLMYLSKLEGVRSQKAIADEFDIDPACVARSVRELIARGYVERTGAEEDLRRKELTITPKGRALVDEARRRFSELDRRVFEDIDPEHLEWTSEALGQALDNLRCLEDEQRGEPCRARGGDAR